MSTRLCVGANSVSEILALKAERLNPIDMRNGDCSKSILNHWIGVYISPLVVNLKHFNWIDIIIDCHSRIPNHCDATNFARMKPTYMNMRVHPIRKAQIEMSYIMNMRLEMSMSLHLYLFWFLSKKIEQN